MGCLAFGMSGAEHRDGQDAHDTPGGCRCDQARCPLAVKGTCHGGTVIDRGLVIGGVTTGGTGRPSLDGDDHKGHVLRVKRAARVTIRDLTVQGGVVTSRTTSPGQSIQGRGAGVLDRGTLRLVDVVVRRNHAWEGAGICNAGVLRFRGMSRVREDSALPMTSAWTAGPPPLESQGCTTQASPPWVMRAASETTSGAECRTAALSH